MPGLGSLVPHRHACIPFIVSGDLCIVEVISICVHVIIYGHDFTYNICQIKVNMFGVIDN